MDTFYSCNFILQFGKKILLLGTEGPGGGDEILLHPCGERYFAGAGRKPVIDKNGATA